MPVDANDLARRALLAVERATAGDVTGVVRQLLGAALTMMPVDQLRMHLTDLAIARANVVADAAEMAKFGPKPGNE